MLPYEHIVSSIQAWKSGQRPALSSHSASSLSRSEVHEAVASPSEDYEDMPSGVIEVDENDESGVMSSQEVEGEAGYDGAQTQDYADQGAAPEAEAAYTEEQGYEAQGEPASEYEAEPQQ